MWEHRPYLLMIEVEDVTLRAIDTSGPLRLRTIAGTYVVMLGFDLAEADCRGLLGFSIHRTSHDEDESGYLKGMKCFSATDPGFPAGAQYSTHEHPVQSFQWADYSAKPGHRYTYRVEALKGEPAALTVFATATITITTEMEVGETHDVHFNRGIAASQEYTRRFGNRRPDQVGDPDNLSNPAYIWLSRGLFESLARFIRAAGAGDRLYVAAYEFAYPPVLMLLKDALSRNVDVRIIYDRREDENGKPGRPNAAAVDIAGLADVSSGRTLPKSALSHNKFILLMRHDRPLVVWTGGTNFSRNGIFGHSNVAHVVKDEAVARKYFEYWTVLESDPDRSSLRASVEQISELPANPPPVGTTFFFSPRTDPGKGKNPEGLKRLADYALGAKQGLFMTFAFGMNDLFKHVYRTSKAGLRFALMEEKTRAMKKGSPERIAEETAIQDLRNMPENVFAVGSFIATNAVDGWLKEQLSGFSNNVEYIHNKFMLIDPLSDDPAVICGSGNFSRASIVDNDENMLIVRGDKRVADIYLGEFMRLWSHHAFRESLAWRDEDSRPKYLSIDDWWKDSFGATERNARRKFFAPS
jgi:hypothetical protein